MTDSSYNKPGLKMFSIYKNKCRLFWQKIIKKRKAGDNDTDKKLIRSLNESKMPSINQFRYIGQFLSKKERKIINVSLGVIAVSLLILSVSFYRNNVELVATKGGNYTEALTGSPKLINPLYSSINTIDSDISSLVFSGLLKKDNDNKLIPDLAEKFEVSEDQKIYTFFLKEDIVWHDETNFSADDVVFTFNAIGNSEYKSPLKLSFEGVKVEKIDEQTVKFILNEPYAAFLELLTVGIMPVNLWQQIPPEAANLADLNLKPMGTGPYKFQSLTKDKNGSIKSYELELNKDYFDKKPYIEKITFKFSPVFSESVAMLNEGRAEGIDYLPKEYEEKISSRNSYNLNYISQPQFTALFFNQNNLGALSDKRVRQALAYALNKAEITSHLQAEVIDNPVLPMFNEYYNPNNFKYEYDAEKAALLLENAGWKVVEVKPVENNEQDNQGDGEGEDSQEIVEPTIEPGQWRKKGDEFLIITITTVDQTESAQVAEAIQNAWEAINVKTNLNILPSQSIQNDAIKSRAYQILLYGIILGSDPDQYPFWHSSQIGPGGLNLANYNNKEVDALLEDGRITNNQEIRKEKYLKFQELIINDLPAIFLYTQKYPYLQSNKIKGFNTSAITLPSDRFNNVVNWYINTKKKIVW
ncbi:MAG: ABC transporter substrate-binding protein [Patescibacteria group bacterium]